MLGLSPGKGLLAKVVFGARALHPSAVIPIVKTKDLCKTNSLYNNLSVHSLLCFYTLLLVSNKIYILNNVDKPFIFLS